MPVWSPGRYAPLLLRAQRHRVQRDEWDHRGSLGSREGSLWRVYPNGASTLAIRYHVFANTLSGTFSVLDTAHANWNGPSLFMYVVDHKSDAVSLHVAMAARVAHRETATRETADQVDYRFENYDRLADTPTEVAPSLMIDSLRIDDRIYRSMVHPQRADDSSLAAVSSTTSRRSCATRTPSSIRRRWKCTRSCSTSGSPVATAWSISTRPDRRLATLGAGPDVLAGLSTAAHEYFHVWNMKRVRAAALGPFDYTREQYQTTLWVGEGWTQYYGQVALSRSGVQSTDAIYQTASGIIRANLTAPGRKEVSARMASFEAPFWDGATSGFAVNQDAFFLLLHQRRGHRVVSRPVHSRSHRTRSRSTTPSASFATATGVRPAHRTISRDVGYTEEDVERA